MKKLLIATSDNVFASVVKEGLMEAFDEIIIVSHQEALVEFLTEEPSHVLVLEYYEDMGPLSDFGEGVKTWKELKAASIEGDQLLLRSGFIDYKYDDFQRLPFPYQISEILKKFKA